MLPFALPQLAIAFPNIDPVIFQIGPLALRWYSLAYIVGIVFGWWYARQLVSNQKLWNGRSPITVLDMDDFVFWATIGVILGGRIGYVLFYGMDQFLADPLFLFGITENGISLAGMSFHGGLIGVTIAMLLFARSRNLPVWSFFDVIATIVPIGIGLGRVANFINSELWGRTTDSALGIVFPNGGPLPRHPSQLYEAVLEGLLLTLILFAAVYVFKALYRPRLITGLFVGIYGLSRFIVEFFREPDAHIGYLAGGWLTMGMVLSLPMALIGIALIISARPVEYVGEDEPENDAA